MSRTLSPNVNTTEMPNHALQRTRRGRRGCNPCVPCAGSLSLGRLISAFSVAAYARPAAIYGLATNCGAGLLRLT